MTTILVVDDELSMREFLTILLEKEGFSTCSAADAKTAVKLVQDEKIDLVISDIRMPDMNGLELLERVKEINSALPFLMITAYASPEDAVTAMKGGAYDYITKPFKVEEIKSVIHSALSARTDSPPSVSGGLKTFSGIIGKSPEMLKIFDLIKRVGKTQANVLIYGESGTGKELVAKALHSLSGDEERPFIPITCSALPETLFESELFGHVKGAFTGALAAKTGLFELANNGTAFLDEIGDLTPLIQTKLLRVIQEREFKQVGGTETVKVNVRIISATNKDLEKEVMNNTFREDLFYRVAVVPLRVPPLRERKGDVPLLVDHFLKMYSKKFNKTVQALSSYSMEVLMDYDFPGNVRELENIIERGVAIEGSNIILPESLTLSIHRKKQKKRSTAEAQQLFNEEHLSKDGLEDVMARIEKKFIEDALRKTNYSKMRAAELLKISFRSLRYKVQKYNITSPDQSGG